MIFRICIQDYFEYITKKHQTVTNNPPIRIYVNEKENRITFKIKTWYYLELLIPETIKLLRSTKSKITKDKYGQNVPHLDIAQRALFHYNIVDNDYQHDSRVLYSFFPHISFGQ